MQPPPPPGQDVMAQVPVGTVSAPPGMIAGPWVGPPRQGSAVIMLMFTAVALLMLAGAIVLHARVLVEQPQCCGQEWIEWRRTMRVMAFVALLLLDAGVFLSLVFGTFVAVRRHDLPEVVRRAMLVGPAVLVGIWLVVVFVFSSLLLNFP